MMLSVAPLLAGGCKTKTHVEPEETFLSKERACASGDMHRCTSLGVMYENAKDPSKAAALYAQACTGGDMDGCGNLGWMYENGTGVTKDAPKAAALYQQACTGGAIEGCRYLRR